MLKTYNRKTGQYEREKIANETWLNRLYGNTGGGLWLELVFKRWICTFLYGLWYDTPWSARRIAAFVEEYGVDLAECAAGLEDFRSFNDFFARRLKPGARPFAQEPELLCSPCDGRLRAWQDIDIHNLVQVKGWTYTLAELLADRKLAEKYQGGTCILIHLAQYDYHRFHFVDQGACGPPQRLKGYYYSVHPIALQAVPRLYCRNKREISLFRSKHFGDIVYVEVGAKLVGAIVQTYTPGAYVQRGEEKGYFKFGGSTVILFLEKDVVEVDRDLLEQTAMGYEVKVAAGEVIGRRKKGKEPVREHGSQPAAIEQ